MKVKLSEACLFVVCDECGLRSPVVMTYMCTPEPNGVDAMFTLCCRADAPSVRAGIPSLEPTTAPSATGRG